MKYIKISILIGMTFSLPLAEMRGQQKNGLESQVDSLKPEMVHVAFGTMEKRDLTSTISVLEPEKYMRFDTDRSVYGSVIGRTGTFNTWGMDGVLILVDGVSRGAYDITNEEIEQITFLKSASAVALYGSEGAKGVILITTKRGKDQQKRIIINFNQGIGEAKAYPNYLNSADYMTLYNEARRNDGLDELYTNIDNYRNGNKYIYPSVDYYSKDYLKRFSSNTNATAEFTGGNSRARFYSIVGFSRENSLMNIGEGKNDANSRFNLRGNIDVKLTDIISGQVNASVLIYNSHNARGNYWSSASTLLPNKYSPLIPIDAIRPEDLTSLAYLKSTKNLIDGKYLLGGSQQYLTTPFGDLYAGGYNKGVNRTFQFSNVLNFDLGKFVKGLSAKTMFNIDYLTSYNMAVSNKYAVYEPIWATSLDATILARTDKFGSDERDGTQSVTGSTQQRNIGFSGQIDYTNSFNEVHNVSATLMGRATNLQYTGTFQPETFNNLGLRASYNYNQKYWATFAGSMTSSSKLSSKARIGISPTLELAWLISEEGFMKKATFLDYLKLNASAGIAKTDLNISNYFMYESTYLRRDWFSWHDGQYSSQSFTATNGANLDLSFIKRKEISVGLQSSFFKNLLTLDANVFITRMDGYLTKPSVVYPNFYSDFVPYLNYNNDKRIGVELIANLHKKIGNLDVNLGINAQYVKTKVAKRNELYQDAYQNRTGKPTDAIFGLVCEGFFNDEAEIADHAEQSFGAVRPGDLKYVDQNGDDIIDSKDEVMIGRSSSPFICALNLTATYKNLTLFVQGLGNVGGNGMKTNSYYMIDGDKKYSDVVWGRWTKDTKETATYPRLSSQSNNNNNRNSDFWIYKSNRFLLNKVQLTYMFSQKLLEKTFINGLSVYVNGSNLLNIAKNKDIMDLSIGSSPQMRYYNIGFNVKF